MKKILLITTGGTIACSMGRNGLVPALSGNELITERVMGDILAETLDLFSLDSTDITPENWKTLYEAVISAVNSRKYDGIVIFHGTDTLEYTASLLYYTIPPEIPVILTGSMLPMNVSGSDGAKNAADAVFTAANIGKAGVFVVFGGKIINGNEAVKRYSERTDAFSSFSEDGIGSVVNGNIVLPKISVPERIYPFPKSYKNIRIIKLSPFTSPSELTACDSCGAVIESYGAGGLPLHLKEAAERLSAQIPVIMTTACIGGTCLKRYEVGQRAVSCGIIDGGQATTACTAIKLFLERNCDQ